MHSATDHILTDPLETDSDVRRRSWIAVLLAILFWIIVLVIPLFSYTFPLPEKPGILLAFGDIDGGGDESSAPTENDTKSLEETDSKASAPQADEEKEASKQEATARSVEDKIKAKTEEESIVVADEKAKKEKTKVQDPKDKQDQENIEAERKAQDEIAQKAAREEAKRIQKEKEAAAKKSYSDLFSGQGDGSNAQTKGDPKGEPDKKNLDGLSSGTGLVGGGIKDRGILYEPEIDENSQKIGRIVVRVCVNADGKVTEAKYTQRGSTATDYELIQVAEKAAKQYVFSPSGLEKQCGTISIDFKVK